MGECTETETVGVVPPPPACCCQLATGDRCQPVLWFWQRDSATTKLKTHKEGIRGTDSLTFLSSRPLSLSPRACIDGTQPEARGQGGLTDPVHTGSLLGHRGGCRRMENGSEGASGKQASISVALLKIHSYRNACNRHGPFGHTADSSWQANNSIAENGSALGHERVAQGLWAISVLWAFLVCSEMEGIGWVCVSVRRWVKGAFLFHPPSFLGWVRSRRGSAGTI